MVSHGAAARLWRSWTVCKPGSVRGPVARPRGWPFIWTRRRRRVLAINPDRRAETPDARSLYDLAPSGACHAAPVTGGAVGSYSTVSPLPDACAPGGLFSVALSLKIGPWFPIRRPWPGVTRRRVSVEPGLSSPLGSPPPARPSDRPLRDLNPRRPGRNAGGGFIKFRWRALILFALWRSHATIKPGDCEAITVAFAGAWDDDEFCQVVGSGGGRQSWRRARCWRGGGADRDRRPLGAC